MYFHEKLQSSLAIFGGLVPLIANVSITAIEDKLLLQKGNIGRWAGYFFNS